jgi:hypothetical protein
VATFDELRADLKADGPFRVVHHAPMGLVDYRVNGAALQPVRARPTWCAAAGRAGDGCPDQGGQAALAQGPGVRGRAAARLADYPV